MNETDTIIDSLTLSIQNFGITKNEKSFDDDLDSIISKMVKLNHNSDYYDTSEQWEILQSNYSKLKYLYELIFKCGYSEIKFIQSLSLFMEFIDKKTQFYLKELVFLDTVSERLIKNKFEESLNIVDPIEKLKCVLNAYHNLVDIVEKIRKEPCKNKINSEFLETFKRRKFN